jgi:hypothetical protein
VESGFGQWEINVSDAGSIHPKNASGPFYVLNGCCTACGVPTSIAPELFEFDSSDHCYVKRQPASDVELEKAVRVLRAQELDCVRYRGSDAGILRRLAEAGEGDHCDQALPGVGVMLRNVVTFTIPDSKESPLDGAVLLEEFSGYVKARFPDLQVRTKPIERRNKEASFALAWFEDHFHPITIRPVDRSSQMFILHRGNLGLSELLDDWLRSTRRFEAIRWCAEEAWNKSGEWQSRPW